MDYKNNVVSDLSGVWDGVSVPAKQQDKNSRVLQIKLISHGMPYFPPTGTIARVGMTKPDGSQILNDATIQGNMVLVLLTEQMLTCAGVAPFEVLLFDGDSMLSSAVIHLNIQSSAYHRGSVESSDEYLSFVTALLQVQPAIEDCEAAVKTTAEASDQAIAAANLAKTSAELAAGAAESAYTAAKLALDAANGNIMLFDPSDGQYEPLQTILNHMQEEITRLAGHPITAAEFDALGATATAYDALSLTAANYDVNAKTLLG